MVTVWYLLHKVCKEKKERKEHSGHFGHFDYRPIKIFHSHANYQISGKDHQRYANAKIKTVLSVDKICMWIFIPEFGQKAIGVCAIECHRYREIESWL